MPFEVTRKAIDFFYSHSRESEKVYICFYGGEPLVNFDTLKTCVEYIKGNHRWQPLHLFLDTNGTLLTDEIVRFLMKNDFFIQVSIDGPKKVHDKHRVYASGLGTHEDILNNLEKIRRLSKEYYQTHLRFAVTLAPPYDLMERHDFFATNELIPDSLSPAFVSSFDSDFLETFSEELRRAQIVEEIERLRELYINTKVSSEKGNVPKFLAGLFEMVLIRIHRRDLCLIESKCAPNGICLPGQRRLFVSTNGRFYPCEKIGESFRIGDVDKGLNHSRIHTLINEYIKISSDECANCWAIRLCRLCFVNAKKGDKLDASRKRECCVQEREVLHNALTMYARIMGKNPHAFDFVKDMVFE